MQEQSIRYFLREWVNFRKKYYKYGSDPNCDVMKRHIFVICCIRECTVLGRGAM